jgi:hypothetical protein
VYLFLDFRLWIYSAYDVQIHLLEVLRELVLSRTEVSSSIDIRLTLGVFSVHIWRAKNTGHLILFLLGST